MNYWWVNHKQTHRAEIEGGYIWSPKTKANGGANETYLNLPRVVPGDVVFSYANGAIQAVGIATAAAQDVNKPAEFGSTGATWGTAGWLVPIEWQLLQAPVSPKQHLALIAPLLPARHSPIRAETGDGNQGCYLAAISNELGGVLQGIIGNADGDALEVAAVRSTIAAEDRAEAAVRQQTELAVTEVEQIVRARRGQGRFRLNVLAIEKQCRLTGVLSEQFLVASHIKPWAVCSNAERLDGNNGLMLSPHVDLLFDRGWISFADNGSLLLGKSEVQSILAAWNISTTSMPTWNFNNCQVEYLGFHREFVFGRAVFNLK
ncbi:HNH endonuclease [Acidovorax sp. Root219]|uniref:HNH endonuclease n=1 Tax=Acidovorax sp. Root219 TaxID=1736493 RepID=UPI0009E7C892|nr:HNH endonuclease [Acidovorax sp. Root219]